MIRIEKAKIEDAKELTEIAKKTFLDDNKLKPENASMEGPPGHDKITEQDKWIKNCFYYKALYVNKIGSSQEFETNLGSWQLAHTMIKS